MLLNLIVSNITILLSFLFLFRVIFNIFAIITGAPIIVTNDAMEVLPLVPEKTTQDLSR